MQPFYLRTNVLPKFDGDGWRPGDRGRTEPIDRHPVRQRPRRRRSRRASCSSPRRSRSPACARTRRCSPRRRRSRASAPTRGWNPRDMLLVGSTVDAGQVITEDVAQPDPTVAALRAAPDGNDPGMRRLRCKLPPVRALRQQADRAASSPRRRRRTSGPARSATSSPTRRTVSATACRPPTATRATSSPTSCATAVGYCQQYAASMAVMLRLADVPSRVVLGYAHPVPNGSGSSRSRPSTPTRGSRPTSPASAGCRSTRPRSPASPAARRTTCRGRRTRTPARAPIEPTRPHEHAPSLGTTRHAQPRPRPRHRAAPGAATGHVVAGAADRARRRRRCSSLIALASRVGALAAPATPAAPGARAATPRRCGPSWPTPRSTSATSGPPHARRARWRGGWASPRRGLRAAVQRADRRGRAGALQPDRRRRPTGTDRRRPIWSPTCEPVRAGLGRRRSPRERMRARFWPASLNWSRRARDRSLAARDADTRAPPLTAATRRQRARWLDECGALRGQFSSKRRRMRSSIRVRRLLGRCAARGAPAASRRSARRVRCRSDWAP